VDRLQRLYPPDRAAAVIMSPWRSDMAPETTIVSICDLSAAVSSAHVGVSMLIEGEPHWARLNA
jgi:hypothetical protein